MDAKKASPLRRTVTGTGTDYWNDSCSVAELTYALTHGAVGATTNPTIVLGVLKKELPAWRGRILSLIAENPAWGEEEIAWKLIEELGLKGAELLRPVFDREKGKKGRLSMQTNPVFYRNSEAIIAQAMHFHGLAPNIQVKIPVTKAGVAAIEEVTARGVNINATVCFTVPQALAVAEAVERGLIRRASLGQDVSAMTPVCTIMVGRLDDWLKVVAGKEKVVITPGHMDWAGVAVIKKAYGIYKERGYRTRLLAAAYRHHMHWSELIGGDIVGVSCRYEDEWYGHYVTVQNTPDTPADTNVTCMLVASGIAASLLLISHKRVPVGAHLTHEINDFTQVFSSLVKVHEYIVD